jgi:photosystem II stability/assembly factor-like uncharacterized protein
VIALGIVVFALSGCARRTASWNPAQGAGDGLDLNQAAFALSGNGWAVGAGMVLRSRDYGVTWRLAHVPYDLGTVAAAPDSGGRYVWAGGTVGDSPLIIRSHDGGTSWSVCRLPHNQNPWVNDLAFADSRDGWALLGAFPATILRTVNGGRTWTKTTPPQAGELNGVACTDGRHAWAVGSSRTGGHPMVLATADGGLHWKVQYAARPPGGELESVTFVDRRHGWAVGHGFLTLATTDGGVHWRVQRSTPNDSNVFFSVAFIDDDHGWVTAGGYPVLWTGDGGRHWHIQALPGEGYGSVVIAR